jgi:hypothetical protein
LPYAYSNAFGLHATAKNQARFELNSSYALFYLTADGALFCKIKTNFSQYWKESDGKSIKGLDFNIYSANNRTSTGARWPA